MSATKSESATIYFDPALHKAVRLKAAETVQSISDIVDEAIRTLLSEDAEDLADLSARVNEPSVSFESFVQELKAAGDI